MKCNICLIDNSIPTTGVRFEVDDRGRLDSNMMRLLLDEDWDEPQVKALVEAICEDEDKWSFSGFKHPGIYLKTLKREAYRPEIVIFDWNYSGGEDAARLLLEVLNETYCYIWVYTNYDQE